MVHVVGYCKGLAPRMFNLLLMKCYSCLDERNLGTAALDVPECRPGADSTWNLAKDRAVKAEVRSTHD